MAPPRGETPKKQIENVPRKPAKGNAPENEASAKLLQSSAALDKMQNLVPKKETAPGFAKLSAPSEIGDSIKKLSAEQKIKLLEQAFQKKPLTERQKLGIQNLFIIKELWHAVSGLVAQEVAVFSRPYWKKAKPDRLPTDPYWFNNHYDELTLKAASDPNFSIQKEMPTDVAAFMNRMLHPMHIDVNDVVRPDQLLEKQNQYIASLRRQSRYDELEDLCEQSLDDEFQKGITTLDEPSKNELHVKSEQKISDQLTDKILASWAKSGLSPQQISELQAKLIETDYQRALHHTVAEKFLENRIPLTGAKAKIWEQYKDIYDPKNEWLRMSDSTWNFIIQEVAINAPLIILSGGVAAGVRTGLSVAARRFLVKAGIEFVGKTLTQRVAIGIGTYAVGQYVEGAAFETVHRVLQGRWFDDLPDFAKSTLFSAATLGLFHGAGKLAEGFFTKEVTTIAGKMRIPRQNFLAQEVAKISNPAIQEAVKQLIVKGHIEAATMVFISAVQHGLYTGRVQEFWDAFNGDELIHAYVSAGSLKIGGAVASGISKSGNGGTSGPAEKRGPDDITKKERPKARLKAKRITEPQTSVDHGVTERDRVTEPERITKPESDTQSGTLPGKKTPKNPERVRSDQRELKKLDVASEALLREAQTLFPRENEENLKFAITNPMPLEGLPGTTGVTEAYVIPSSQAGGMGMVREVFYRDQNGTLRNVLMKSALDGRVFGNDAFQIKFRQDALQVESQVLDVVHGFGEHPNIMKTAEGPLRDSEGNQHLVLERAGDMPGYKFIHGISTTPKSIFNVLAQVIKGLDFLHDHGVIHRDLKWSNVMIDSATNHARIIDFGTLSVREGATRTPDLDKLAQLNKDEVARAKKNGHSVMTTAHIFEESGTALTFSNELYAGRFFKEYDYLGVFRMVLDAAATFSADELNGTPFSTLVNIAREGFQTKDLTAIAPAYTRLRQFLESNPNFEDPLMPTPQSIGAQPLIDL